MKYLFLANEGGTEAGAKLRMEPFNALMEQNDYEVCIFFSLPFVT